MLESQIERASLTAAKTLGWWGIKLVPTIVSGLPDRMFVGNGRVVFVEFKTEKGKVTKLQRAIHKKFMSHGITVHVCRTKDECIEVLNAATK